jgi:hypothetical protein
MTPGDSSVKFRNVSGKNPVLFCVEGAAAPDFYFSGADYSYYDLYKTPDKTRTRKKDSFDRAKVEYTLVVTLKSTKD